MMKRIGGLWKQTSKKDKKLYLSGSIDLVHNDLRIVVMKNEKKQGERSPDWIIYKSEPMKQTTDSKIVEERVDDI